MNPVYYIVLQLRNYNFSDLEIITFLSIIYNCLVTGKDIESTIANGNNNKFINAYYIIIDDIYSADITLWKEWVYNNYVVSIDSTFSTMDTTRINMDRA